MRHSILAFTALMLAPTLRAQSSADLVTFVNVPDQVAATLAAGYGNTERTWCVSYVARRTESHTAYDITGVTEDTSSRGTASGIKPPTCGDLPSIHSHPAGTCQPSPADQVEYLTNLQVPFHGVLCAPRSIVWVPMAPLAALLRQLSLQAMIGKIQ